MAFTLAQYDWPAYQNRVPFAHQKTTVEFMLANPRCFVLNEMGTGKTMSALWAIDILIRFAGLKRIYVVAPLSILKSAWAREIFYSFPHIRYAICHGDRAYRLRVMNSDVQIVIINPDGVRGMHEYLLRRKSRGSDLLIIDESTLYKSGESDRTKLMMELADDFKGVWGMTGDAAPNKPTEAWSQAKIVVPNNPLLPQFYGRFRDATMYRIDDYNWGIKEGAERLVAAILQPSIRFALRDCIDLPPTIYSDIEVPMTAEQQDAYAKMRDLLYVEMENGEITAANSAVKLMKLVQIAAGSVKDSEGNDHRINCKPSFDQLEAVFEQTHNKKMIVVCAFQATFKLMREWAVKKGLRYGEIYGDVKLEQRDQYVEDLQRRDLNILALQPQAAAHGLTLTAAAHVTWWTLTPSNEHYKQTNARVVRPGQSHTQNIIRFIRCKAERHLADILDRKEDLSSSILSLLKTRQL